MVRSTRYTQRMSGDIREVKEGLGTTSTGLVILERSFDQMGYVLCCKKEGGGVHLLSRLFVLM